MGIRASWLAVKGMAKDDVLANLGAVDTGQLANPDDFAFSCAELPNGWFVVLSLDFNYPTPERMAAVSIGGQAIASSIEEHVMYSVARGYEDGAAVWSVDHNGGEKGTVHLDVAGRPPPELAAIRERVFAQQAEEDRGEAACDYVFSIAPELTCALCGFRADGEDPPGGWPEMTLLHEVGRGPGGGGLLKALAALFGKR